MRSIGLLVGLCALGLVASSGVAQNGGSLIAYGHREPDDRVRVWSTIADGSLRRRLPLGSEAAYSPRWSSDGRRLLFARPSGTYVADMTSSGASTGVRRIRRIAPAANEFGHDWSPDGTMIVLARQAERERCTDLFTMRTDGSRLRRLTYTAACEANPAWSPDGLHFAFELEGDDATEIVVTNVLTANLRSLGEGSFPAWAPDGRFLAYLGRKEITIVDPTTGTVQRTLRPDLRYDELENGLAWSPDGKRLVHGFHDLEETFPLTHLGVIDADGTDSFRLTPHDTFPDMEPDWQPICTLYGTNGDDVLTGTPGDDLICGLRGNDIIRAGLGDDTVLGGDGNDIIQGRGGSDRLFGAAGDDRLYALDGLPDVVNGGPGRDRFWGDQVDTVSEVEDRRG